MGRREELLNEYERWTVKYVEADDRFKAMLPKAEKFTRGAELVFQMLTRESLAEINNAEEEMKEAQEKLRELREELGKLPPDKK